MTRSQWLLAERGQVAQGIVSLGPYEEEPQQPKVSACMSSRRHGVPACPGDSSRLRRLEQAYLQLYYWVGTNNGRAVGFAKNFGFRTTDYRRPSRSSDLDPGEEIAMVLSLEPDATSAPNPTSGKAASREGPLS